MTPVATETDLATDDDAGRLRRLPLMGVALAGALLLSACGGSPEGDSQAGPEEPSASASSSKTDDGDSGEESSSAVESSSASGGDGSSEESSGEPVSASSDGPAQNWPEPEAPANITENTKEGAEATVEYWWELYSYAQKTGDTTAFADASDNECETCDAFVSNVQDVFRGNAWYANVSYEIDSMDILIEGDSAAFGPVHVTAPPFDGYDDSGEHREFDGMDERLWQASLIFRDDRWVVSEMARVDSTEDNTGE